MTLFQSILRHSRNDCNEQTTSAKYNKEKDVKEQTENDDKVGKCTYPRSLGQEDLRQRTKKGNDEESKRETWFVIC